MTALNDTQSATYTKSKCASSLHALASLSYRIDILGFVTVCAETVAVVDSGCPICRSPIQMIQLVFNYL